MKAKIPIYLRGCAVWYVPSLIAITFRPFWTASFESATLLFLLVQSITESFQICCSYFLFIRFGSDRLIFIGEVGGGKDEREGAGRLIFFNNKRQDQV